MRLEKNYDVIVVGAGPGGSSIAAYLGRAGLKTLLLDKAKFPRDKTCGDALSGKSMTVVRELGLVSEIEKLPHAKISGVTFSSPSGKIATVPFPKSDPNRDGGTGYCMRRMHTDNMFFNAAKKTKNVDIIERFSASEVIMENEYAVGIRGIELADKERKLSEFRAKIIVGADGVNSVVAKCVLGEKAALEPKHTCDALRVYYDGISEMTDNIEIHFFESIQPGYFWIFPLEGGKANVGLGLVTSDLQKKMKNEKKNLVSMLNEAIANEPVIKERFRNAKPEGPITGWRLPFGSQRKQLAGNGWVLVGDAASLVDPFSGEGVGNATTAARLCSKVIADAIAKGDLSRENLSGYEKRLWEEIGPELDTSYKMQQVGRIKWLLDKVIEKAATKSEIRELIAASLANEKAKRSFENPLFYLKILFS
ncbi:MAG: NAD(P)/FAD-dependent oxidoreductase [Candidatus Micrarchaeota archaeon]